MKIYELEVGDEYRPDSIGLYATYEAARDRLVEMVLKREIGDGYAAIEAREVQGDVPEQANETSGDVAQPLQAHAADADVLHIDPSPWWREAGGEILSDAEGGFILDCRDAGRAAFILRAVRFYVEQHGLGR